MKKKLLLIVIISMLLLAGCSKNNYKSFKELENGSKLQRGDIIYSFYGALSSDKLKGKQIGVVDNDKNHKIFEINGFSSDEWIIEYYDVIMSTYSVYKSDSVLEIPEVFRQ